ncbi:MAG: hypothetical protein R3F59_09850 [Myxococcota bacterium]
MLLRTMLFALGGMTLLTACETKSNDDCSALCTNVFDDCTADCSDDQCTVTCEDDRDVCIAGCDQND